MVTTVLARCNVHTGNYSEAGDLMLKKIISSVKVTNMCLMGSAH